MKNFKGMRKYAEGGQSIDTTQFMPSMTAETSILDGGKGRKIKRRKIANPGKCTYKGC